LEDVLEEKHKRIGFKVTVVDCLREPCLGAKIGRSWTVGHPISHTEGMCPATYKICELVMEDMLQNDMDVMQFSCPDTKTINIYEVRKVEAENE